MRAWVEDGNEMDEIGICVINGKLDMNSIQCRSCDLNISYF